MIGRWQRPALQAWKSVLYQRPGIAVSLRYMSEGQSQPKKTLPQLNTRKATRGLWEFLDPRWKKVMNQWKDARSVMSRYASQFHYHASKARMSIMEANKKLAEQEQERADQRLTYDKDVATSETIKDLPSRREIHRRKWARKLEFYLDSLQETIFTATRALNDVTGYSSIQRLRKSIELMETNMEQTRENLKALKEKYATAIEDRIQSQKQLNELLQRKSTWSPADLERFTQIYKDDALNQKKEQTLKGEVSAEEEQQEKLGDDLYRAILTRYHEEQIWSDKIRRTSTWGTFILMGVNIILFLVFQLLLEPWKRRRLTRSFEGKVKKALDDYAAQREVKLEQLITSITPSVAVPTAVSEEVTVPSLGNLAGTELDHPAFEPLQEQITDLSLENDEISKDKLLIRKLRKLQLWFRDFLYKFRPSAISDAHSQTLLSNIELYVYSTLLLLLGALSTKLMP